MMRVAIMTDDPGWHGAQLRRAFRVHGVEAKYVSLSECRFDLARGRHGLWIPGFREALPAAVWVRAIAAGTFEQVTLRLGILHALRELGVPVYNDARSIERSVDKGMTSFLLHRAGIPTPATWVTESVTDARKIMLEQTALGHELVAKPLFGSQGEGLMRLQAGMDVPEASSYHSVFYLQRYIGSPEENWHDWRVLVAGERALAAMMRRGRSWVSNVAQGARCEEVALEPDLAHLACEAARAVGADYAGVDIIRDAEGKAYVLEVNSIPAWKGLQSVTAFNIAERLVDDLLCRRIAMPLQALG